MAKDTQHSKQFKEDAVRYRKDHPELTVRKAAENFGVSESALENWMKSIVDQPHESSKKVNSVKKLDELKQDYVIRPTFKRKLFFHVKVQITAARKDIYLLLFYGITELETNKK